MSQKDEIFNFIAEHGRVDTVQIIDFMSRRCTQPGSRIRELVSDNLITSRKMTDTEMTEFGRKTRLRVYELTPQGRILRDVRKMVV